MELNEVKNLEFRQKGYMVVRNVLSPLESETLRQKADVLVKDLDGYRKLNQLERDGVESHYSQVTTVNDEDPIASSRPRTHVQAVSDHPQVSVTSFHARRENRVYPLRKRAVGEEEYQAVKDSADPYMHFSGQITHLADNDEYFRSVASHPKIVSVLNEILGSNVKLWFDHIYNKAPYNDEPPYGGANRYHQDGFFHLDRRSVTCWISLDGLTLQNGPFHYVPMTLGYGRFMFDDLGEDAIGSRELSQEEVVTLNPGDAVFHDRWTLHATGPNESSKRRRGWALHYADAESHLEARTIGQESLESVTESVDRAIVTPERYHIIDGTIRGNRFWHLICGSEFQGCI